MSTPSLQERIEKVVDTFVQNSESFTLLDVSEEVKQDGHGWISHSAMKTDIEDVLRDSFTKQRYQYYTITTIVVQTPVGPSNARLFHHVNTDPNSYTTTNKKAKGPQQAPKAPPVPKQHPTNTARVLQPSNRTALGYFEIPKHVWQRSGFNPSDSLMIDIHPHSITLYKVKGKHSSRVQNKLASDPNTITVKVPPAGRFRISPRYLKLASLDDPKLKTLTFAGYTDKIVILTPKTAAV